MPKNVLVENNGDAAFEVYNEEEFYKYQKLNNGKIPNESNNKQSEIKEPHNIKFNLIDEISYRGLDNVGATCYMNATLQCLANIKPVTKYLLDPNNYCFLYNNLHLCLLTMEYIQVLIGLYCDDSRNGSYCPQNFKNIISEYNPLFKGVQANDSKDLIIFLLEYINNELVKIQEEKQKEKNKNIINIIGDNNNISINQ